MRFMMFMKPNLTIEPGGEGWLPPVEAIEQMTRFNNEMERAGVLLTAEGLHAPSEAVQVSFESGGTTVTDGPFAEAKELIGGYWIIDASSKAEAVEWAKRCPIGGSAATIEVRQIQDISEWPAELREAADRAST